MVPPERGSLLPLTGGYIHGHGLRYPYLLLAAESIRGPMVQWHLSGCQFVGNLVSLCESSKTDDSAVLKLSPQENLCAPEKCCAYQVRR